MGGKLKGVLIALILILIIFTIAIDLIGDLEPVATTASANADYPAVLQTVFGLWWILPVLLLIGAIVGGSSKFRRGRGRRRRR